MTTAGVWDAIFAAARRSSCKHEAAQECPPEEKRGRELAVVVGGFVRVGWRASGWSMWAPKRAEPRPAGRRLGRRSGDDEGGVRLYLQLAFFPHIITTPQPRCSFPPSTRGPSARVSGYVT